MFKLKKRTFNAAWLLIIIAVLLGLVAMPQAANAQDARLPPQQQLARDIFQQLIEINTTHSSGDTTVAAEAMAARLKAAGLPTQSPVRPPRSCQK